MTRAEEELRAALRRYPAPKAMRLCGVSGAILKSIVAAGLSDAADLLHDLVLPDRLFPYYLAIYFSMRLFGAAPGWIAVLSCLWLFQSKEPTAAQVGLLLCSILVTLMIRRPRPIKFNLIREGADHI